MVAFSDDGLFVRSSGNDGRFHAVTGMTPALCLARERIALARRQIVSSTDPITVIARRCGFADASHFGKCFRRFLGITPRSLRTQAGTASPH